MAAIANDDAALSMKLVVDDLRGMVLFAEASEDVVDFIFSLLDGPGEPEVFENDTEDRRAIDNFCDSVDDLDDFIRPAPPPPLPPPAPKERFFVCSFSLQVRRRQLRRLRDAHARHALASCGWPMAAEVRDDSPGAGASAGEGGGGAGGGSAREEATMMCVMKDDLTVTPMAASMHTVRDLRAMAGVSVQEMTVRIGREEGLAILNAAMESTTVLTDVFFLGESYL